MQAEHDPVARLPIKLKQWSSSFFFFVCDWIGSEMNFVPRKKVSECYIGIVTFPLYSLIISITTRLHLTAESIYSILGSLINYLNTAPRALRYVA